MRIGRVDGDGQGVCDETPLVRLKPGSATVAGTEQTAPATSIVRVSYGRPEREHDEGSESQLRQEVCVRCSEHCIPRPDLVVRGPASGNRWLRPLGRYARVGWL